LLRRRQFVQGKAEIAHCVGVQEQWWTLECKAAAAGVDKGPKLRAYQLGQIRALPLAGDEKVLRPAEGMQSCR